MTLKLTSHVKLSLKQLSDGFPALTPVAGAHLAEAASVALGVHTHKNPVNVEIRGIFSAQIGLDFFPTDEQMRRTYGDSEENTEDGACGIALLLLMHLTKHTVVHRSRKGTGIDYFLGDKDDFLFQNTARLEVSGIGDGTEQEIKRRMTIKKKQSEQSDYLTIPAYIVIVEFSRPIAEVFLRHAT